MAEELFASSPVSYKMDRKSPGACELREAVNRKLFDFMGNYTDEVLAEYIVVLVCNGKHQNQARDDLEAFLGEDSGKFVAWLWDHLAKENYTSGAPLNSSGLEAGALNSHEDVLNKEQQPSCLPDFHTNASRMSDIPLPKDGKYDPLYCSTNSNCSKVIEIPERVQRWCPNENGSLTKDNNETLRPNLNEVYPTSIQAEPTVVNKTTDAYQTGDTKLFSSVLICSPEIPSADDQLHDEYQHQKIVKIDSSALLHRSVPVPRTEPVGRGLRSIITDDHQSRLLPTRNSAKTRMLSGAVESSPQQIARQRGNVWDRLGKPHNEDDDEMRGKRNMHDNNLINTELIQGKNVRNSRSMWIKQNARSSSNLVGESVVMDSNYCNVAPDNHSSECRLLEHNSNNVCDLPHVNNSKRKRLYNEPNTGNSSALFSGCNEGRHQGKETPPKTHDSFPVKFNRSQSFGKIISDVKDSRILFSESTCTTARIEQNSPPHKVNSVISTSLVQPGKASSHQLNKSPLATTPTQKLVPKNSQFPSKSGSPSKAEIHIANYRPVKDEVLDVKSKLHQIETNVLAVKSKLCSKLTEMRNVAKPNALAGVQNHSEEDIESRTVLVTNVHFAATREALLSHFTKCGSVAKVVMLTDTITAQPKGAAYVVFAHKESVEKAVAMSGTSFFSRILTVMRKADMPPDFLVPSASTWKCLQPFQPQPFWKGSAHYASTHLQWRRETPTNRESSISATTNGLDSSATGE